MTRKNPSKSLTLERVDKIVELVLKGRRYLKKNEVELWPNPKEAWSLGLEDWSVCLEYINSHNKYSHLTSLARNNRGRKVHGVLEQLRAQLLVDNEFVWKVQSGWSNVWGYVCAPSEPAARQIGYTMFAMASPERLKVTPPQLNIQKVSLGGWDVAAKHNIEMISFCRKSITGSEERIASIQLQIDSDRTKIESLMSAAILGGELSEHDETSQAG
jgi:hypothetical protein